MSDASGWAQKENSEDNRGLVIVSMTEVATASRAAWHTWCCSRRGGGGWRSTVDGLLRKDTEKSHTQSSHCISPFRSVSPLDLWKTLSHYLPAHIDHRAGKCPGQGVVPLHGSCRQTDLVPSSNLESPLQLTSRFFSWKVRTHARNQPSSVLLWSNAATTISAEPPCGKHCCLCHCLFSSLQQLLKKTE